MDLALSTSMRAGWHKRLLHVFIGLVPLVGAILVDAPMCPSATMTGIPCPGCGLTRATLSALQGNFAEAFHFHPLFWFVTPLYVGMLGSLGWSYVRGGGYVPSQRFNKIATAVAITAFVLIIGVWVSRFFGAFGGPVPLVR